MENPWENKKNNKTFKGSVGKHRWERCCPCIPEENNHTIFVQINIAQLIFDM